MSLRSALDKNINKYVLEIGAIDFKDNNHQDMHVNRSIDTFLAHVTISKNEEFTDVKWHAGVHKPHILYNSKMIYEDTNEGKVCPRCEAW